MKAAHTIIVALSLVCIGCTTPPEVKQALIAKDQAYVENERLMEQYRELVSHVTQRHQQWYRYVQTTSETQSWRCNGPPPILN